MPTFRSLTSPSRYLACGSRLGRDSSWLVGWTAKQPHVPARTPRSVPDLGAAPELHRHSAGG